ncbi:hypothetical protein AN1V17_36960 [Vallitalea sediminicola]
MNNKKIIVKKIIDSAIIFVFAILLNRRPELIELGNEKTNFYCHILIYSLIIIVFLIVNSYIFKRIMKKYEKR